MKYWILSLGFIFSAHSWAGPRVGNGGDVIICQSPGGPQLELLDHYEARHLRNIKIDLGSASESYIVKVQKALKNLERIDHSRAKLYEQWLYDFTTEVSFTNDNIVQIPDTGATTYPAGCELVQIAVHQDPELPGDSRYIIRKDLWNLLDNDGRAGLVLHELVYRDLVSQNFPHSSSKFARYYNAFISSALILPIPLKSYYNLLLSLGFETMDTQFGFPIYILAPGKNGGPEATQVEFFSDDIITRAARPARHRVPLIYRWRGQDVLIVTGACSTKDLFFENDGTPSCFDVSTTGLFLDLGWLKGSFKSIAGTSLAIRDRGKILGIGANHTCYEFPADKGMTDFDGEVDGVGTHYKDWGFMINDSEKVMKSQNYTPCTPKDL